MKLPFIKFFVRDWISDSQLRMVSMAARGFWFECLCIMHMAHRRGYLETATGTPINDEQLARLSGSFIGEIVSLKSELLENGIPSVEEETGTWYCRRMVNETIKSEKCSKAGLKGGGNPLLVTNPDTKNQNTETRIHIPETRIHISLKDTFKGNVYTDDFLKFWEAYPKKVAKKTASKAWNKAKDKPDIETLVGIIEKHKATEQWKKSGGDYIPHPASWLNAGGWEDEIKDSQHPIPTLPPEETFCTIPTTAGEYPISHAQVEEWQGKFTGCDVRKTIKNEMIEKLKIKPTHPADALSWCLNQIIIWNERR